MKMTELVNTLSQAMIDDISKLIPTIMKDLYRDFNERLIKRNTYPETLEAFNMLRTYLLDWEVVLHDIGTKHDANFDDYARHLSELIDETLPFLQMNPQNRTLVLNLKHLYDTLARFQNLLRPYRDAKRVSVSVLGTKITIEPEEPPQPTRLVSPRRPVSSRRRM